MFKDSNNVVVICIKHKGIKNRRHYFLTAPCISLSQTALVCFISPACKAE